MTGSDTPSPWPAVASIAASERFVARAFVRGNRRCSEKGRASARLSRPGKAAPSSQHRTYDKKLCNKMIFRAGERCQEKEAAKMKKPAPNEAGFCKQLPAATYSPTHLRMQYHRRWQA